MCWLLKGYHAKVWEGRYKLLRVDPVRCVGVFKMESKEMLKTKVPKGFIFRNIAKLGGKANWKMVRIKQSPGEIVVKDQLEGNGWLLEKT